MSEKRECEDCGQPVSRETGYHVSSTLADNAQYHIHCYTCRPVDSRGYTIADLQAMKRG